MKTLFTAATMVAVLLTAVPVAAGSVYADAALLATIESVNVVVADDVKEGCLLNASGIKARLSTTLERSGIRVSETSRWYLDNPGWVERVKTGAYRAWLEQQYGVA